MGSDRADEGAVRRALAEAGYVAGSAPLRPGFRRWRWLARLPEDRIAFFADGPEAAERLGRERVLLDLLGRRVRGFAVPAVEHVSPDGRLQVRRMVEGTVWADTEWFGDYGPERAVRERALAASPAGRRLAGELGRALAELHGSVTPAQAVALGVPGGETLSRAAADLRERLLGHLPEPAARVRPRRRPERLRGHGRGRGRPRPHPRRRVRRQSHHRPRDGPARRHVRL